MTVANRTRIVWLAASYRLPAIYALREFVEAGGLTSYAASLLDQWRKGAKPGDMPVEQPVAFELSINTKAAKALGLTIPPSLLVRADELIQ